MNSITFVFTTTFPPSHPADSRTPVSYHGVVVTKRFAQHVSGESGAAQDGLYVRGEELKN
jgi:hypothetical protein